MNERTPYLSDLTDEQWNHIRILLPRKRGKGGRPKHSRRDMLDAIWYVMRTGCQWRMLPHDFPPWQSVYGFFRQLCQEGIWEQINTVLRVGVRQQDQREAEPSVVIIDSQSVKTAEKGGLAAMMVVNGSKDVNGILP